MGCSSGGGGGGGMGGGMITNIVSSVANVGAGHFANNRLNKGTDEALGQQDRANALYSDLYGQTQADYKPYQEAGTSALDALLRTYGLAEGQNGKADYSGFENSPDFLWAQRQGVRGRDMSAASSGRLYSGAYDKSLAQYNQGLATQFLGNYRGGLQNISSGGLGATNALANYRMGYGNQLGQGYENKGDLLYARRIGQANINYRNVAAQDSIWGAGSGGGGGNQNALSQSGYGGGSSWAPEAGSPGSGSYTGAGSSSYQFNPWGQ